MADEGVLNRIEELVAEEHRLLHEGDEKQGLDPAQHERLQEVQVALDQAWDLLRQRRARRRAGLDPDEADPRDPDTIHRYLQ